MYFRSFFLEPADPTKASVSSTSAGASGYKISFTEFDFFAFFVAASAVLASDRGARCTVSRRRCRIARLSPPDHAAWAEGGEGARDRCSAGEARGHGNSQANTGGGEQSDPGGNEHRAPAEPGFLKH